MTNVTIVRMHLSRQATRGVILMNEKGDKRDISEIRFNYVSLMQGWIMSGTLLGGVILELLKNLSLILGDPLTYELPPLDGLGALC